MAPPAPRWHRHVPQPHGITTAGDTKHPQEVLRSMARAGPRVAEGLRATTGTQLPVAAPSGHGILGAGGTERQQDRWQYQEVHSPTCFQQSQRTQTQAAWSCSPKNPRHPSFWTVPVQEGKKKIK